MKERSYNSCFVFSAKLCFFLIITLTDRDRNFDVLFDVRDHTFVDRAALTIRGPHTNARRERALLPFPPLPSLLSLFLFFLSLLSLLSFYPLRFPPLSFPYFPPLPSPLLPSLPLFFTSLPLSSLSSRFPPLFSLSSPPLRSRPLKFS